MAKSVLYSVCYNTANNTIFNIKAIAIFNNSYDAIIARDTFRAYYDKSLSASLDGYALAYGVTQKAGRWIDQAKSIEDAIKNVGVKAFTH